MAPKQSVPRRGHRALPYEIVGGVLVVLVAMTIGTWPHIDNNRATIAARQAAAAANRSAVPESFYNFSGQISSIHNRQLSVDFRGFQKNGQLYSKQYSVNIDDATSIVSTATVNDISKEIPASISDVTVGRLVIAAGAQNLAPLTEFTATKIILQQP